MSNKNSFSEATAKSYSQALYELGSEEKNLVKLEEDVNSIIMLISQSEDFNSLIKPLCLDLMIDWFIAANILMNFSLLFSLRTL